MRNFYVVTPQYVSLAVRGLVKQASAYAIRFEAETANEAQQIGEDIGDKTYAEWTYHAVISEAEKMRIDGQPELF